MKTVKSERNLEHFNGEVLHEAEESLVQDLILRSSGLEKDCSGQGSSAHNTAQSGSSVLDQGQPPGDDTGISSPSSVGPAPVCRQFWRAGNYNDVHTLKATSQHGKNYLQVHPTFLHSNATSHKWVFGALAELLDNAFDEIQNGATFVSVDKTVSLRDGRPALLIQDDGSGMSPDAIRRCMSFGFSDKKIKSTIGQYGNGFKTSTMRLGADVIVFSRHIQDGMVTQSSGLLSYTFLTQIKHDRIVVPFVDYKFNATQGKFDPFPPFGKDTFLSNISIMLQWSPFSTEAEMLNLFEDIGSHGTKIIIYNLWQNNDGTLELDFDTDPKDIQIAGYANKLETSKSSKASFEQHISNRLRYSLRAYLSILYLRVPETFRILLRGDQVELHNLANELKFQEYILYKPHSGGCIEGQVITTIGFVKEAPLINVHGFSIYHKNRLILPFQQVLSYQSSRGRGVVGVLEANFIQPSHNKQEFERTSLFQKLEARLKDMALEYWDYHCGLIGYHVTTKLQARSSQGSSINALSNDKMRTAVLNHTSAKSPAGESEAKFSAALPAKRKENVDLVEPRSSKRQFGVEPEQGSVQLNQPKGPENAALLQHKKLRARCSEHQRRNGELAQRVTMLRNEIDNANREYDRLMEMLKPSEAVKEEGL